jgi:hypothetical protein
MNLKKHTVKQCVIKKIIPDISGHLPFVGFFNEPRNILAKLPHCVNTLFVCFDVTGFESFCIIPVAGSCRKHSADTKIMINGVNSTDRAGSPLGSDSSPGILPAWTTN